ncbi:MAG TPA: hypothetical protein VLK65_21695 [Vicinamibacteria bacterium]|nr:hypothetical protein [Vicinamibacteria bacterium]
MPLHRRFHQLRNLLEVLGRESTDAMLELTVSFHGPWESERDEVSENGLRLSVRFDETTANVGDVISCRVDAQRLEPRAYGMLIAEIGLPPGADVDRASLQRTLSERKSGLERYDVLPDRIVAYIWPPSGGAAFEFSFRPRLAVDAKSAPSSLYDYYNPDAAVVVPPARFRVR